MIAKLQLTTFASLVWLLSGCQSFTEKQILLSDGFTAQANQYSFKGPIQQRLEIGYRSQIDDYDMALNKVGKLTENSNRLIGREYKSPGMLDWVRSGAFSTSEINEYEVIESRDFSYSIRQLGQNIGSGQCDTFRLFLKKVEETYLAGGDLNSDDSLSQKRKKTLLVCLLELRDTDWRLVFNYEAGKPLSAQLTSAEFSFRMDEITQVYSDESTETGGQVEGSKTIQSMQAAGVSVWGGRNQQLAAISFLSKNNNLWVNSQLPKVKKELLLSTAYALNLFNWLDPDWRS